MKTAAMALMLLVLSACAGVTIRPISTELERAAHSGRGDSLRGYIVYAPQVVFSVGEADVCTQPLQNGTCPNGATKRMCVVGNPIVVPDFSKPFVVDIESGLGKAGADVQIADGWRLAGVKDNSDNTALLALLQKVAGAPFAPMDKGCPEGPGLYRWKADATPEATPSLERVFPK